MTKKIPTTVKNDKLVKKRREQIVRAAIKCFSKKGFHKTTLPDLAAEAGISHGNIYKYISTKEEILFLIHDHMMHLALEILERNIRDLRDPVEKLRRIVRSRFDIMLELPNAYLLMYQEANALTGDLRKSVLKDERRYLSIIEDVLKECIQQDRFKKINPRVASNFICLLVDGWELKRWDLRNHVNRIEFEQWVVDYLFDGISKEKYQSSDESAHAGAFSGKSVLVINSRGKISKALVSAFLAQGAKVAIYESHPSVKSGSWIAEIPDNRPDIFFEERDGPLTDKLMSRIMDETGPIDCAVYCPEGHDTGLPPHGESSGTLIRHLQIVQQQAPVLLRPMREKASGSVIYITPNRWEKLINPTEYEMVKGGIEAFSKELAGRNVVQRVNINCVVPGFIGEPEDAGISDKAGENITRETATIRWGEASDISSAVLFLAADASRYVTGQVITVDGGYSGPGD